MDNENKENTFQYTYCAKEHSEIQCIRQKYLPPEQDKLERLRRLDKSVSRKAMAVSVTAGILSCLLMGVGMCCCLVWGGVWFGVGIAVGLAGIAGMALNYPMYTRILRKERERIAPEILRLTDELMQE